MSNKRTFNADSSEEDTINPLPAKKAATSSPASEQSGTRVPKGRGGGDLPKISAFPAKTPKSGGRGSSQGDKSPARAPRFSTNTGEGSAGSAQGGFTFSKNKTVAMHFLSGQKCIATISIQFNSKSLLFHQIQMNIEHSFKYTITNMIAAWGQPFVIFPSCIFFAVENLLIAQAPQQRNQQW